MKILRNLLVSFCFWLSSCGMFLSSPVPPPDSDSDADDTIDGINADSDIPGDGDFTETADQVEEDTAGDVVQEDGYSDPADDWDDTEEGDLPAEEIEEVAEAVDTIEEEEMPNCYEVGCELPEGGECCEGLVRAADCIFGDECSESVEYCINCGDGVCGVHENIDNCRDDCNEQCAPDYSATIHCMEESFTCNCNQPECIPQCLYAGWDQEGWYYTCGGDERLILEEICDGLTAECLDIATRSEGWNALGLIQYASCHNTWECL